VTLPSYAFQRQQANKKGRLVRATSFEVHECGAPCRPFRPSDSVFRKVGLWAPLGTGTRSAVHSNQSFSEFMDRYCMSFSPFMSSPRHLAGGCLSERIRGAGLPDRGPWTPAAGLRQTGRPAGSGITEAPAPPRTSLPSSLRAPSCVFRRLARRRAPGPRRSDRTPS
jgi:hypothetical protein